MRDLRVGKRVAVPDQLVQDVRLGREEWPVGVADELRREEATVGQNAVKGAWSRGAVRGLRAKPGEAGQRFVHVVELGNTFAAQREGIDSVDELAACDRSVQWSQRGAHGPPHSMLVGQVL